MAGFCGFWPIKTNAASGPREREVLFVERAHLIVQCDKVARIVDHIVGGSEPSFPLDLGSYDASDLCLREHAALPHASHLEVFRTVYDQHAADALPITRGFH